MDVSVALDDVHIRCDAGDKKTMSGTSFFY